MKFNDIMDEGMVWLTQKMSLCKDAKLGDFAAFFVQLCVK